MSRYIAVLCWLAALTSVAQAGLLSVPKDYSPDKTWPVLISTQDNPDPAVMKDTPYFLVHAGGQAAACTKAIKDGLRELAGKYNIDPHRVYGTGFSRGGQEILMQAWRYPDIFAAIAPVDSDLREKPDRNNRHLLVKYLWNVPTLMIHGTGDQFRATGQIEFDLMKEAKCNVTWQDFEGGHDPSPLFKKDMKVMTDFFAKHKLDPYPKKVVHVVENKTCARAFWVDAVLAKDGDDLRAAFTVEIKGDNQIAVEANDGIAGLELMLNDKLLDMAKPVKVSAGEKVLYEGPAKAVVSVKLRDAAEYQRVQDKPLWQELTEIRAKAPASAPASKAAGATTAPAPATQPAGAAPK